MSFGTVNINLHSVNFFNTRITDRWVNPGYDAQKGDGTIVLWDVSGSMTDKKSELKLIASALKCVSNTQGMWNVKEAYGQTSLVDAANVLDEENTPGVSKCMIISDGVDNASTAESLIARLEDDGRRVLAKFEKSFTPFHSWKNEKFSEGSTATADEIAEQFRKEQKEFYDDKCEKVAMHLSNMKMELVVVAVGTEVKDFVKALSKPGQRANVAHISSGASAKEVIHQIASVTKKPRRAAKNTVEAVVVTAAVASADTSVTESFTDADVTSIETEAAVTSVGQKQVATEYDHAKLLKYVDAVIEPECAKYGHDIKHVREAIATYLQIVELKDDVPGPILHSKFGGVYQDPVFVETKQKSKFNTLINACLSLLSAPVEDSTILANFADDITSGLVGPLFTRHGQKDSVTCITQDEFSSMGIDGATDIYMRFAKTPHYGKMQQMKTHKFLEEISNNEDWKGLKNLKFWKGNASHSAFVTFEANKKEEARAGSPSSSTGSTSCDGSKKRSYAELEAENEALKKEIEELKKAKSA